MVHGGGERQSCKRPLSCSPLRPSVSGRSVGPRGVRGGGLSSGVGNAMVASLLPNVVARVSTIPMEHVGPVQCGWRWVQRNSMPISIRGKGSWHTLEIASEFTAHVSTDSLSIPLSPDSCLCKCCYSDCRCTVG